MRNGNEEIRNGNEEMRLSMGNLVHADELSVPTLSRTTDSRLKWINLGSEDLAV